MIDSRSKDFGYGVTGALFIALGITACGQEPSSAHLTTPQPPPSTPTISGEATTVTLITGDRVTLRKRKDGGSAVQVDPGPGRAHVTFSTQEQDGALWVVPHDVMPLTGSGQLDLELFNIHRLLADGLGDDRTGELPLLVTGVRDDLTRSRGSLASLGVSVDRTLPKVGALAIRQHKGRGAALLASLTSSASRLAGAPPMKIWLDRKLQLSLEHSAPQIGAPAARQRGLTGAGVVVAVLDTGVDATHPDLAGKADDRRAAGQPEPGRGAVSARG